MDAIRLLRQRAADKRDKAVKAARDEFRKTARLLDELQDRVGTAPEPPRRRQNQPRPIVELIAAVIPKDRTFTLSDVLGLLQAAEPGRQFHIPSVRSLFPDLVKAGTIRKVRRAANGCVHWAAAECEVQDTPIAALSIADAAAVVLEESGPLSAAEIVVSLKERGYRPDADPRVLLSTLRYSFKRNRGRFDRGEDGRWNLIAFQSE
jgi:hypothetical protein